MEPMALENRPHAREGSRRLELAGEPSLLSVLQEPIRHALAGRASFYRVEVDWVGRCGEIMVRITGSKGRLPLLFSRDQLEPGFVRRVVTDVVERFAF